MKDAAKLNVYFSGDKTLFLIPLYQRNYAWQKKHCERLFSDLVKISKNNIRSHFFGSIVSVKASEVEDDLLIIDGQQRITTISLLIMAAIHCVENGYIKCEKGDEYISDIRKHYLLAKYRNIPRLLKLRPIDNDLKAYDAIYEGDPSKFVPAEESGITLNYLLFVSLLKQGLLNFDQLMEAIERLIVIDIRLDSTDNPQLIFESLNSCGKDLEEADKVRNYLLMSLTKDEQEDYYRKYWSKIETCTNHEPTMFIRDYLTVKEKTISSINELYFDFKSFDEKHGMPRKDLLEDMLKYAEFYNQASFGKTASERLNRKFKQLSNIGSSVCMPFYLSFLDYAKQNSLSEDLIYEVLDTIENYWARRIICEYPSNAMNKVFALLHSDVLRIIENHAKRGISLEVSYADLVKHILLKKNGYATFPKDEEVKKYFPEREIYRIPLDYRCFLFERMENLDSREGDDQIAEKIKSGKYTIEHIMPQTPTQAWKQALGKDWEKLYEKYLHTFANLTLTAYNSNYSNHTFQEKKAGYIDKKGNKIYGFQDTPFRLNSYVKTVNQWTETEILKRQEILLNNFLSLWPMITSNYQPLEKESDSISFAEEEAELTGRRLISFSYRGVTHEVYSWKEMLVQVCKLVYDEKPAEVSLLAVGDYWFHVTGTPDKMSQIADNCYVWSSSSVKTIQSTLRYLFKECDISESELIYNLAPLKDNEVEESDEDTILDEDAPITSK